LSSQKQQEQIDWRRAKVLEMLSKGETNQSEIARKLQVDKSVICKDVAVIRRQAQENLQHHIQERIPEEYQICMTGMKLNLKQTLEIAETAADPKTKLQARAIANDCYKYIMDLTTNGVVVTDALKYVQGKLDHLNNQEKNLLQDIKEDTDTEAEEETTTNGIF
jgi:O-phosphoseryl-tRNA(Cys) synthetase